ncbi:MAG: ABC transporter ATP-binding protein, partial [Pseudomonadota bacterium]
IAISILLRPKVIIADEPTTALDVTVQAQILKLIKELQVRRNIGVIFISHDLSVVADIADTLCVMQNGRFVEQGSRDDIFRRPQHDYTRKLLAAVPSTEKVPPTRVPEALIEVKNLSMYFAGNRGDAAVAAVDDISLQINRHEILGLVGESGSGKSTLGRCILRLLAPTSGSIRFDGQELLGLSSATLKPLRRRMQMIFQDPYASLNPRMTVYDALAEPLLLHGVVDKKGLDAEVFKLMDAVGLARTSVLRYPHEFSGGQRQRIAIGRAIGTRPEFIVADEPVSALDVTIQAQILDLLLDLVARFNLTMLFVSHDLAVVRYLADRIVVMKSGRLVETGTAHELFTNPREAYTQALLSAIPGKSLHAL